MSFFVCLLKSCCDWGRDWSWPESIRTHISNHWYAFAHTQTQTVHTHTITYTTLTLIYAKHTHTRTCTPRRQMWLYLASDAWCCVEWSLLSAALRMWLRETIDFSWWPLCSRENIHIIRFFPAWQIWAEQNTACDRINWLNLRGDRGQSVFGPGVLAQCKMYEFYMPVWLSAALRALMLILLLLFWHSVLETHWFYGTQPCV